VALAALGTTQQNASRLCAREQLRALFITGPADGHSSAAARTAADAADCTDRFRAPYGISRPGHRGAHKI